MSQPFAVLAKPSQPRSVASAAILSANMRIIGEHPDHKKEAALAALGPEWEERFRQADTPEKRAAIKRLLDERLREHEAKIKPLNDRRAQLDRMIESYEPFWKWLKNGDKTLHRCEDSAFHKLREAAQTGDAFPADGKSELSDETVKTLLMQETSVFLVQHDWAKVFDRASDLESAEWKLPAPQCAFELMFGDRRLIAIATSVDGVPDTIQTFGQCPKNMWPASIVQGINRDADYGTKDWQELFDGIRRQIRAISISLDAEIAVSNVVRAPHKLNSARVKVGQLPLTDYHVVSLARRQRSEILPSGSEPERHIRLHFRRGHWRHYQSHKTWIRWTLVGDPDLGFIEKHYVT